MNHNTNTSHKESSTPIFNPFEEDDDDHDDDRLWSSQFVGDFQGSIGGISVSNHTNTSMSSSPTMSSNKKKNKNKEQVDWSSSPTRETYHQHRHRGGFSELDNTHSTSLYPMNDNNKPYVVSRSPPRDHSLGIPTLSPFTTDGMTPFPLSDYTNNNNINNNSNDHGNIRVFASFREEITCLYDTFVSSDSPYSVMVQGDITTNFTNSSTTTTSSTKQHPNNNGGKTFYLSIKDPSQHIDTLTMSLDTIQEVIHETHLQNPSDSRLFRVYIPMEITTQPTQLIQYTCTSLLRPFPLKLEIKPSIMDKMCHVQITIQCNRSYTFGLHNILILLSVPPGIQGESFTSSRKECQWDSLKRLVVWNIPLLKAGSIVDDWMQFHMTSVPTTGNDTTNPSEVSFNFPAMIRCIGSDRISNIDMNIGMMSKDLLPNQKLEADVSRSFTLIHRFI